MAVTTVAGPATMEGSYSQRSAGVHVSLKSVLTVATPPKPKAQSDLPRSASASALTSGFLYMTDRTNPSFLRFPSPSAKLYYIACWNTSTPLSVSGEFVRQFGQMSGKYLALYEPVPGVVGSSDYGCGGLSLACSARIGPHDARACESRREATSPISDAEDSRALVASLARHGPMVDGSSKRRRPGLALRGSRTGTCVAMVVRPALDR